MIDQRRRRLVDLAFVATALVTGAASFSNQARQGGWPGWAVVAGTAGGIAACAALWFRRRSPVGVAATILPLAVVTSFAAPAGLLAFFTVALYRRLAVVLWLGVPALAALCIAFAIQAGDRPETGVSLWLSLSVLLLLHVAVAAVGMYLRARYELLESLRDRAERAEAAQQEQARRAREQERARIAREMHDVLAHRISLLSLEAGSLEFRPDAPPEEVARAAGVIRACAHEALDDLRRVVGVLREAPGHEAPQQPQPTLDDLPGLVEESRAAGMSVRSALEVDDAADAPDAVGRDAYRIVQEG